MSDSPIGPVRSWPRALIRRLREALTANLVLKAISFVIAIALYAYFHGPAGRHTRPEQPVIDPPRVVTPPTSEPTPSVRSEARPPERSGPAG